MSGQINSRLKKLVELSITINKDKWGKSTRFRPPCKPLLILSVIDMAATGSLQENLIEPSFQLAAIYNRYWEIVAPSNLDSKLASTFVDLENDGVWEIVSHKKEERRQINSMRDLQKNHLGAKMQNDLFPLLMDKDSRKNLRETITKTYFTSNIHADLLDAALINHGAAIYSKELLSGAPVPSIKTGRGEKINQRIASLGFNAAIVKLYDHRCAICGIKQMTPEGHSAIDAVHIVPWHISKNDHPSNGLALCKICGWSFENGLLGINEKNKVTTPTAIRLNGNLPGHLLIFSGRTISKLKQEAFRPSKENLQWHQENTQRD